MSRWYPSSSANTLLACIWRVCTPKNESVGSVLKQELRLMLGKAAHEKAFNAIGPGLPWEALQPDISELYCSIAEAVVQELAKHLAIPVLTILFSEEDMRKLLERDIDAKEES